MGRLMLILLLVAAAVLVWKAFGPAYWQSRGQQGTTRAIPPLMNPGGTPGMRPRPQKVIKGPDDDEEFLWNLEKQRFKERRAKEEAARRAEEEKRRRERLEQLRLKREAEEKKPNPGHPENPQNPQHPQNSQRPQRSQTPPHPEDAPAPETPEEPHTP